MGVRVREAGSGHWYVFINHKGRRKSKYFGKNKRLAEEAARKIEAKLLLGDLGLLDEEENESVTFKECAQNWLENYVKALRKRATYERYEGNLRLHIYRTLGNKQIDKIKRGDIKNLLLKKYKSGLSRSSVCLIRDVISGVMNYALDEELISKNVVRGVLKNMGLERDNRVSIEAMTQDEVNLFLDTCERYFSEYYAFFLCAFRTGMRLGEILGLEWGDVDWKGRFIKVQRSYKVGWVGSTKTGKVRRVDMSGQLFSTLRALYTKRKREALGGGRRGVQEIIFHKNGKHMEQNRTREVFKRILRKAGLRDMRFHDIRHTYASLLLSRGVSAVYVKEQLGHSSIQITVDIYGHLISTGEEAAVNCLDGRSGLKTFSSAFNEI